MEHQFIVLFGQTDLISLIKILLVLEICLQDIILWDITDSMGCISRDSVNVLSNPAKCIKVFDAFSNDDDVNEFWKIDNIDVYPQVLY